MKKNQDKGNIVFFIGVLIFVVALGVGYFTEVSALIIDLVMGLGLIFEFAGLCICYKKDKKEFLEGTKPEEEKVLEEEKEIVKEEKVEDVVEVEKEVKKPAMKKSTTTKSGAKKKTTTNKATAKKAPAKKGTTTKKKTTKKTTTKKSAK